MTSREISRSAPAPPGTSEVTARLAFDVLILIKKKNEKKGNLIARSPLLHISSLSETGYSRRFSFIHVGISLCDKVDQVALLAFPP